MERPDEVEPGFAAESGPAARPGEAQEPTKTQASWHERSRPERVDRAPLGRSKWLGFGITAALVGGAMSGVASADNVSIGNGSIETGSAAITAQCSATPLAITASAKRTTYSAVDGYWVSQIPVTAVPVACQSKPYVLSLAKDTSPFSLLADWSGTTPGAGTGTLTAPTATDGVDINSVPSVVGTDVVRLFVLVSTS